MSHPNAPPILPEQRRMENFYHEWMVSHGMGGISFARNKFGEYMAPFARFAWLAWQEAQRK